MSDPLEREQEIHHQLHLPGPSFAPIVLSAGVAIVLFGLVPDSRLWRLALVSIGVIVAAIAAMVWLRDAMREYEDLPE
jgi:hypothetical protein